MKGELLLVLRSTLLGVQHLMMSKEGKREQVLHNTRMQTRPEDRSVNSIHMHACVSSQIKGPI